MITLASSRAVQERRSLIWPQLSCRRFSLADLRSSPRQALQSRKVWIRCKWEGTQWLDPGWISVPSNTCQGTRLMHTFPNAGSSASECRKASTFLRAWPSSRSLCWSYMAATYLRVREEIFQLYLAFRLL